VFLSARTAAKALGVNKDTAGKWLHELEHYGFLAKVQGHFLGLDGEGKAARYRLTDRWYAGKEPTYDFQNWDGVLFEGNKKTEDEKQNPVRKTRTPCPKISDIRGRAEMTLNGNNRPNISDIRGEQECPKIPDMTSYTISLESSGMSWCVPIPSINPCDEADSSAWIADWLQQVPASALSGGVAAAPSLTLAEIREAMGYRH
jgi:hypothetical protein